MSPLTGGGWDTGRVPLLLRPDPVVHETHVCRDCGAEITLPYVNSRGTCWFCKGVFVFDALIAGYDTFEESRLACLACNERMDGNWRPAASPKP